jgi:dTDP-glucose pyrophosphorylase/CBS domain-containing protein
MRKREINNIDKLKVKQGASIRHALKQMDEAGIGFCVIVDGNDAVVGVVTDGDFRRAILNDIALNKEVCTIANKNFLFVGKGYVKDEVSDIFNNSVVRHIPIIENRFLIGVIVEEDFCGVDKTDNKKNLNQSVVIMAGGKGTRLDPFTRILPKPLIPIGNDPILKLIIDEFKKYNINDFHITINDKGKMIKAYFYDHNNDDSLNFIEEDKPLGTAGALKYLEGKFTHSFFVSNCDIIIKCDYSDIVKFHEERNNDLTIVGSMQYHKIPYGVCEIDNGGDLVIIKEKPEYNFLINTGMYLLEPKILKLIPQDEYCDMTTLISYAQEKKLKIGVFPVSEKSWFDVGQWEEYENTRKNFKF